MSERDMYALDLDASLRGKILHEHYRVERKAAQGGMAWMFQVTHTMFNETMALKLLYPHLTDDPRIRKRFIDEAKIQFRLKHPNIVNVTEIIQAGRLLGIVQEWVHGSSLKDYLRGCRSLLTLPQIRFILSPILDALHTAHEQGVIHRDIKPANILLAGRQLDVPLVPKLTDFGVAKVLDELDDRTATGVLIGTFKFTSPEQIKESKAVDRRADIYSIGVMLYQLCTGQFPFTGGVQKVLIKHLMDPPEPPDSINPDLRAIACVCLIKSALTSLEN